jgi:hypothetical protein
MHPSVFPVLESVYGKSVVLFQTSIVFIAYHIEGFSNSVYLLEKCLRPPVIRNGL